MLLIIIFAAIIGLGFSGLIITARISNQAFDKRMEEISEPHIYEKTNSNTAAQIRARNGYLSTTSSKSATKSKRARREQNREKNREN